ncbi:uncharacterized protein BDW43DRAFT_45073 [Aspergillus alliaceus]|uniref:uncharacterized protein n=1 Tax=Petromyces alliaceus TaxID=209559 RepID=UPI0012A6DC17|nr:uncharacterized protein BDW43DRAFT_45073 [Aspergillus alliaceus]KAB8234846.1 hypothetical protein BDW43DRAFT_45073 [Aspergillus alliaceus]
MPCNRFVVLGCLSWLSATLATPLEKAARAISLAPAVSHPTSLTHTPFRGTPTVTGALSASSIGTGVPPLGIPSTATTYPSDGKLHNPQPGPYIPAGGVGTGGERPVYNEKSDFDYESLALYSLLGIYRTRSVLCGLLPVADSLWRVWRLWISGPSQFT